MTTTALAHAVLAAETNPFQPGIWTILVVVLLIGLAVLIAAKDRRRRDSIKETLDASTWTAECMDPSNLRVRRMLALSDTDLAVIETQSRDRESYPWSEIGAVTQKSLRVRMQSYPGVQISMRNGHARDLLVVAAGMGGRRAYEIGAAEATQQIRLRLKAARDRQPEEDR